MKELRGECFVVGQDERGPVHLLDDLGHGKGLARTGDAEQRLVLLAGGESGEDLFDGAALITARLVVADELKVHLLTYLLRSR